MSDTDERSPAAGGSRPADGVAQDEAAWTAPSAADAAICPYCGRPFTTDRYRDLHRGQTHADQLTEAEIDAYRSALTAEREDLKRFRLLALGGLVALYFGFLLTYAVVT